MKNHALIILFLGIFYCGTIQAQNSVSIGTEQINNNAVLQLVSPGNNQGFLVPKLTTSQRLTMTLQTDDDALLVFDSDMGSFFFWYNSSWIQLSNGNDQDMDPANEIQDLSLNGSNLTITNNPNATPIDLSYYLNTDDQVLTFNTGTNELSIEDGNTIDLTGLINDADADITNEIQNLQLTGNVLSITDNPAATPIDLSGYLDDTDEQDLTAVLTEGNSAGNMRITNLADPVNPQDAATKSYVDDISIPSGGIIMWSGSVPPTGWALCNGSNGTPDLRGRFIVGYNPSVPAYNNPGNFSTGGSTAGNTGGEATHTLSLNEIPSHNHGGGNHVHQLISYDDLFGWNGDHGFHYNQTWDLSDGDRHDTNNRIDYSGTIINTEGGGQPHENRPPYYVLAYIMKL